MSRTTKEDIINAIYNDNWEYCEDTFGDEISDLVLKELRKFSLQDLKMAYAGSPKITKYTAEKYKKEREEC